MRTSSNTQFETRKLSLHERSMSSLAMLREATEAASDSEVVRHALVHYEQLVDDASQRKDVLIRSRKGEYTKVPVHSAEGAVEEDNVRHVKRNLVLPTASALRLDELRRQTGAKSDSEVIREAIIVYDRLVSSVLAGNDVVVRDADGNEHYKTIAIPMCKRRPHALTGRLGKAFDLVNG